MFLVGQCGVGDVWVELTAENRYDTIRRQEFRCYSNLRLTGAAHAGSCAEALVWHSIINSRVGGLKGKPAYSYRIQSKGSSGETRG